MSARTADVSVIIVTYNSAPCIAECVASVRQQQDIAVEIVVVDNASADNTVGVVRGLGPDVRLIASQENTGFGRGCNLGAAASSGKIFFFLNPDAQFDGPAALADVLRAFEKNPRWGGLGTRVARPDGKVENPGETTYPEQKRMRCDFSKLPGKLAWVLGASMGVRREAFDAIGGFDPGFFLYSEETDLCLRLRQAGWEIGFLPEVTARHIGGASDVSGDPYRMWLLKMTGLHRFWAKHYPREDVRRIVRLDWFRSGYRKRWHGMMALLQGKNSRSWLKSREYAAISEASKRFLADNR